MLRFVKFLLFVSLSVFLVLTVNMVFALVDQSPENRQIYETISMAGICVIVFNLIVIVLGGAWVVRKAEKEGDDYFTQ